MSHQIIYWMVVWLLLLELNRCCIASSFQGRNISFSWELEVCEINGKTKRETSVEVIHKGPGMGICCIISWIHFHVLPVHSSRSVLSTWGEISIILGAFEANFSIVWCATFAGKKAWSFLRYERNDFERFVDCNDMWLTIHWTACKCFKAECFMFVDCHNFIEFFVQITWTGPKAILLIGIVLNSVSMTTFG